ncbi:MAG: UvrD-helicase domain-containing protein [Clostridia bacterium]|nr:UvrD-helicase domain-containing protein [Clostridia bacterium]
MPELKPEQKEAIQFNEGNILVSASAGSGKTFVMIERAIRLIAEGKATVKEILAVTFTDAAATQMQERIRKALIEKIGEGKTELEKEINELYNADISTLHAFCLKIIKKYCFVIGKSPDFAICEEDNATILKNQSIEKLFKECYTNGEKEVLSLLEKFKQNRKDEKLKEIILKIYDYACTEKEPFSFLEKTLNNYTLEGLKKTKEELYDIYFSQLKEIQKDLEKFFNVKEIEEIKAKEFLQELYDNVTKALSEGLYTNVSLKDFTIRAPGKVNTDNQLIVKEEIVKLRDSAKKIIDTLHKTFTDRENDLKIQNVLFCDTKIIIDLVKKFSFYYDKLKEEENVLDFNDLEHCALKILNNEEVRKEISLSYKFIFVDEYQDINGVQEEIISLIANDNLFMVGDEKQSIYGFRGCRPEIFVGKEKDMQENGQKTVRLNYNFRSAQNVINLVNEIFGFCMTKEFFGKDYSETSKLISGGGYNTEAKGRTALHFFEESAPEIEEGQTEKNEEEPRLYDILEEIKKPIIDEASNLSAEIQKIIEEELGNTYFDIETKTEKVIDYSDIIILSRVKKNDYISKLTEDLIRRNIPIISPAEMNICEYPEIDLLINLLKLIDQANQDIPLVAVLKSAIGNFSEEDLFNIAHEYFSEKENKGSFIDAFNFYITTKNDGLKERLVNFNEYINGLRFLSDYYGAKKILEKVIEDSGIENCLIAANNGESKIKRLRKFLSLAESGGKEKSVSEFLEKIENAGKDFCVFECADENAIKIETIHHSKGLEYPVVIVCGLERERNRRAESEEIMFSRTKGFAIKYYDKETRRFHDRTILRSLLKEHVKQSDMKEEMRLFYVATTRAKYSLHLLCAGKDERKEKFTGATRFIDYIPSSIVALHDGSDFSKLNARDDIPADLIGTPDQKLVDKIKNNILYTYPYLENTKLPLKRTVTSALPEEKIYGVKELFSEEITDNEKGTIAHKILENYDFKSDDDLFIQVEKMVKGDILSKEEAEKVNIEKIKNAIDSQVFEGVKNSDVYKEKGLICEIEANKILNTQSNEKILLQGVIDLLLIDSDGAKIIDYKYSAFDMDTLEKRYKKQLELYSFAVENILKIKVKSKTIVNILTGKAKEIK